MQQSRANFLSELYFIIMLTGIQLCTVLLFSLSKYMLIINVQCHLVKRIGEGYLSVKLYV